MEPQQREDKVREQLEFDIAEQQLIGRIETCSLCQGDGRVSRVNRSACARCDGRGRVPRRAYTDAVTRLERHKIMVVEMAKAYEETKRLLELAP